MIRRRNPLEYGCAWSVHVLRLSVRPGQALHRSHRPGRAILCAQHWQAIAAGIVAQLREAAIPDQGEDAAEINAASARRALAGSLGSIPSRAPC